MFGSVRLRTVVYTHRLLGGIYKDASLIEERSFINLVVTVAVTMWEKHLKVFTYGYIRTYPTLSGTV